MIGLERSTVSPSSSSMSRSTPWVLRVLRAHVDDHRLVVVGVLDVEVAERGRLGLGQAQHGADLAQQLAGP